MKKYLYYIFAVMVFTMNLLVYSADNLIKNPGFEEGLKYWSQHEWSGLKGKINFIADKKDPRSGESCAKVEWISGGDNILLTQRIKIDGKKSLMLTFWAKSIIQASTNDRVQATVEFFDKAGKRISRTLHKIFTTNDIYQEFSWNFSTPPKTAAINIHLRCRRTTTCFDDLKLIESYGVYLKECIVWLPGKELVLDIYNDLNNNKITSLAIELYNKTGKLCVSGRHSIKAQSGDTFDFAVKDIRPGNYKLKVYPVDEPDKAIVQRIVWPENNPKWPAPYNKLKVRNNFVTELLCRKNVNISIENPLKFMNPRIGWVFISAKTDKNGTLELPGTAKVSLKLKPSEKVESMQFLPAGENIISVKNSIKLNEITITTMPEVIASEFESDEARYKFVNGLMESPAMLDFLRNSNVIMERFANSNSLKQDEVPYKDRERIARWRATGRKTIANVSRTGFGPRWGVKPKDTEKFWMSRVGLTELDGLSIDEFASEDSKEIPYYDNTVKKINAKYPDKTLYAYTCAAWYAHTRTVGFRKTLAEGNHAYAPELYMREQCNEGAAKLYINTFFDYLRQWERAYPRAMHHIIWTFGSCDGYYASYVIDTFANASYKYFLDLQFCLVANDPSFFGIRGVCPWIIRYTKPDTLAWEAKLIRHYCIEGKRTMLSDEYGYKYDTGHLKNPDCANGLDSWKVEPAATGSIKAEKIKDYGFNRGTRNTAPDGDDVIVMTRVPGKVNRISQTIKNLKPGHDYEVSLLNADYDDVIADKNPLKVIPVRITIKGAKIDKKRSIINVYPVVQKMKYRKNGICGNHYSVVFRATSPTAELIISDEAPDVNARQFHDHPFAPVNMKQKRVLFNFVQIQELLPQNFTKSK